MKGRFLFCEILTTHNRRPHRRFGTIGDPSFYGGPSQSFDRKSSGFVRHRVACSSPDDDDVPYRER